MLAGLLLVIIGGTALAAALPRRWPVSADLILPERPAVPSVSGNTPVTSQPQPASPPPVTAPATPPVTRPLAATLSLPGPANTPEVVRSVAAPKPPAVVVVAPPAPKPPVAAAPALLAVRQIQQKTEEDLHEQIFKAPRVALDLGDARKESDKVVRAQASAPAGRDVTVGVIASRPDLTGLPTRQGRSARISAKSAKGLASWASRLKDTKPGELPSLFAQEEWRRPERVPALVQVLTAGPETSRFALVRQLALMEGRPACEALARVAVFDPHPDVRREAVTALKDRPGKEYRPILLGALSHPWEPAAEHAAEALAALKRLEAVPTLLKALKGLDPLAPYATAGRTGRYVKELVRVKHVANCLLCHPPSLHADDPGRAHVPGTGKLQEVTTREFRGFLGYGGAFGTFTTTQLVGATFIRADVTFLRQDYSVTLRDARGGVLRSEGRFDLFVRERVATPADVRDAVARKRAGRTAHRRAAEFALRELTGREPGPGEVNWRRFAEKQKPKP
jgi:hypothetical protein